MKLADMIDVGLLDGHLADKVIKEQTHPTAPLLILNYTEKAQFDRLWDDVTLQCRGLIHNMETGEVVARPFRKFFNVGEYQGEMGHLETGVTVWPKLDGSLGILYHDGDGWAIATRGSFTSDQALHATEVLRTRYTAFEPIDGLTYLFEIIYPENRIVVDYGATDDLFLLTTIDTETGLSVGVAGTGWPGPTIRPHPYESLTAALTAPQTENTEGFVLHWPATDLRLKFKFDEYVRLHRLVTGMSARHVWEFLALGPEGRPLLDLLGNVPDEFYDWVTTTAQSLRLQHRTLCDRARITFDQIVRELPAGFDRKAFAERAVRNPDRALLFLLLDGKDIGPSVWKLLRPDHARPFHYVAEDVA